MIDQDKRDAIISESARWFGHDNALIELNDDLFCSEKPVYGGGIALFSYLSRESLEKLIAEGFANPENNQNISPTLGKFLNFIKEHPNFTVNGYAVEAERDDCRVTITGLEYKGKYSEEEKKAFLNFAARATNTLIENEHLFCWWD